MALTDLLGIDLPLVQAPMAGVSSPAMAAAVSDAGALGSIGVGATDAAGARAMIAAVRERTRRPFNVNLFCHHARGSPTRRARRPGSSGCGRPSRRSRPHRRRL